MKTGRNDVARVTVETTTPVRLDDYDCGCWGRHQPPRIVDNTIVLAVGVGYRSRKHLHGQNLYVLNIQDNMALLEFRKFGDMFGAGLWHYLIGVDGGTPWVAHVPQTTRTVAEAVERLKPAEVRRAEVRGLQVKRQGDYFFVPARRVPKGERLRSVALDDDHIADELVRAKTAMFVRGDVRHRQHATVTLGTEWHKAIRNNAVRTGRFAKGSVSD